MVDLFFYLIITFSFFSFVLNCIFSDQEYIHKIEGKVNFILSILNILYFYNSL
jgi:hypothetical protein